MGNAQVVALLAVRVAVGAVMIAHGGNHWRGGGRIGAPPAGSPGSACATARCRPG